MIILAIETSCDETAVALVKGNRDRLDVVSSFISSQIKIHAPWGGVVPNLAAREHLKNIIPLIEHSLNQSGLNSEEIDLIATTSGPGLIPALLIGSSVAKTLSWIWEKPLLGINHIEGHIYSNFLSKFRNRRIKFPLLCLIVSGGHTQLVLMKNHLDYRIIGQTLDDAAGEAFDKAARILGLGYPGGPAIAQQAMEFPISKSQFPNKFKINLPRPMINSKDLNFSFSGLKTAVLYLAKKNARQIKNKNFVAAVSREFQQSIIDVLISKSLRAAEKFRPKTIMIAGGVSANRELRRQFQKAVRKNFPVCEYWQPDLKFSMDNAVMIAAAAYWRWKKMNRKKRIASLNNWKKIKTDANLKLV